MLIYPIRDYFGQRALQSPESGERTFIAQLAVLLGVFLKAAILHVAVRKQPILFTLISTSAQCRLAKCEQAGPAIREVIRFS